MGIGKKISTEGREEEEDWLWIMGEGRQFSQEVGRRKQIGLGFGKDEADWFKV